MRSVIESGCGVADLKIIIEVCNVNDNPSCKAVGFAFLPLHKGGYLDANLSGTFVPDLFAT